MTRRPPGFTGLSTLVDRLIALAEAGRIRYLGTGDHNGDLAVEVNGQTRELDPPRMLDWLEGFTAAEGAALQPAEQRDPERIASVRAVLVNPSVTDQARILMRLAMEESGTGVVELAARSDVMRKPLQEALRFGKPSVIGITAVLGLVPGVRPPGASRRRTFSPLTPVPPTGWREPKALTRMRLLGYAHEQGVVSWVGPTAGRTGRSRTPAPWLDVNRAFAAKLFDVVVGERPIQVRAAAVGPWLTGVADALAPEVAGRLYQAGATD